MAKKSIENIAQQASGRDRYCKICPLRGTSYCGKVMDVCNEQFVRGFIKGVKYQKSLQKKK